MPQQRSLFSFFSPGAAAASAVKPLDFTRRSTESTQNGNALQYFASNGGFYQHRARMSAEDSRLKEPLTQKEILERIQQKFVRKEKLSKEQSVLTNMRMEKILGQNNQESSVVVDVRNETVIQHNRESSTPVTGIKENTYGRYTQECPVEEKLVQTSHGIKRIREASPTSSFPVPSHNSDPQKRARLLEALGADDCFQKGGAWEAVKAKFEWMMPSKIRDAKGRRPDHPFYDSRTLHIPADVFRKLSASQKQYWTTKSQYLDTVLFFKVGNFYELYEMDAEIGHKELDWKLIVSGVGKCRQVGCPESGIDDAIQKLVSRGYKVGRMEQIETGAQARAKGGPNVTVQRELTQVITSSTVMDGNMRPEAVHLLALKEEVQGNNTFNTSEKTDSMMVSIGFAFVDAAAGRFYVGSICDDSSRSGLLTLLTQVPSREEQVAPQEVLYEIGGISDETRKTFRRSSSPGLLPLVLTPLQPDVEFMESSDAMRMFRTHHFFKNNTETDTDWFTKGNLWPLALESVIERGLAIAALGALACYLKRMKCDSDLLANGVLSSYEVYKGCLRLDGQTVDNLELLQNKSNGGKEGTLLSFLDNCVTQFGKRLLRRWICHPLQHIGDIQYRLDALDELRSSSELSSSIRAGLRQLPDLERLVARLRGLAACPTLGFVPMAAKKVHQRRLKTFCSTISGIRAASELLVCLRKFSCENEPLKSKFLQLASTLPDSDAIQTCLGGLELCIDQSSKSPRLLLLQNSQEDEDELEVQAGTLSNLINDFNEHGFQWMKIVEVLGQLDVLISFASAINGSSGPTCRPQFIASQGLRKGGSVLNLKGLWHPYATGGQGGVFVPNDVELGSDCDSIIKPYSLLLTGPNMGGKSTLLRATCLAVILAQLGCFVPCESCTLSPVDTIFTRLGASDHIITGDSTFMVECTEAASVLHHATSNSLVVLDELGRGTSTFDGYAIAYAVFHRLVNSLGCRLMFATHYHPLTEEFATNPLVKLGHMACSFEPQRNVMNADLDKGGSVLDNKLVFLYKLTDGSCPKSYGLQVALLAGIPPSIVNRAESAAGEAQKRLSVSFDEKPESVEEKQVSVDKKSELAKDDKQFLQAILSASNVDCSDVVEEDSYLNLLGLWQELRRNKEVMGE